MRVVGFWDMGTWWVGVCLPVCVCVCVCELPLSVGVCLSGSAYFSISCPSPTLTSPHGHSLSVSLCVSMVFVFGCLCLDVCICLPMYRSYRFHAKIRWQQTYHAVRAELKETTNQVLRDSSRCEMCLETGHMQRCFGHFDVVFKIERCQTNQIEQVPDGHAQLKTNWWLHCIAPTK